MTAWWLLILLYDCSGCQPDLLGAFKTAAECHAEADVQEKEQTAEGVKGYACIRVVG